MTPLEFTPAGALYLHVQDGDVVVRGQAGRTSGQIVTAPGRTSTEAPRIETTESETHVYAAGALTVALPLGASVRLVGRARDVVLRELGEVALEGCDGDLVGSELAALSVSGPITGDTAVRKAAGGVVLHRVNGDLAVAQAATLQVEAVSGDASFTQTGSVQVGRVEGDLAATQCGGVQAKNVQGDATLSSITGAVAIQLVGGDLNVISPGQSLAVLDVQGDAQVRGPAQPGARYWINAGGSVALRVSGALRVIAQAGGDVLAGADLTTRVQEDGRVRAEMGDDAAPAEFEIAAKGDVILNSPARWQSHHSAVVEAELRRAMDEVKSELKRTAVNVTAEVRRAAKGVADEVERQPWPENVGASMRNMVRDLLVSLNPETLPTPPAPPVPPTPPAAPPSDELRMVLDMLAVGKITADEAARLIEALKR